jgi:hypothetical protein
MLHFTVNFASGRKFISSKASDFATQDQLALTYFTKCLVPTKLIMISNISLGKENKRGSSMVKLNG